MGRLNLFKGLIQVHELDNFQKAFDFSDKNPSCCRYRLPEKRVIVKPHSLIARTGMNYEGRPKERFYVEFYSIVYELAKWYPPGGEKMRTIEAIELQEKAIKAYKELINNCLKKGE